ncbi:molybdenum cofactor biosynthesis protein MoeA [Pseudomonas sp. A-1]|uniref:SMI1/KNR4 family protein n=1 Tax=Pseudomonas sp. A-1 TaxID=1821274 RepID=UPI0010A5EB13|nr:SMI1/KNR4 family protein [Pseudomonas sp. A-1]THG82314.1 molybdenum cofactor biosynthesis protein MoeA [Pseudomonas sp. A-1]
MKQQWERLEAWLKANNPALLADLNPPATDAEIRELEQKLGVTLPADFVACLKVHNGQRGEADWLFDGLEFMSSRKILRRWSIWLDLLESGDFSDCESRPSSGVRDAWWSAKWIPFTYNGSGDHLCLDLDPAAGGKYGQIIEVWHDQPERTLQAPGFREWFSAYVDCLE